MSEMTIQTIWFYIVLKVQPLMNHPSSYYLNGLIKLSWYFYSFTDSLEHLGLKSLTCILKCFDILRSCCQLCNCLHKLHPFFLVLLKN